MLERAGGFDDVVDMLLANLGALLPGCEAVSGRPRGVVLHGPPGSGKSYLADVLATTVAPAGALWVGGKEGE
eukprot:12263885-Alexandrium_andersonii.AAC.1